MSWLDSGFCSWQLQHFMPSTVQAYVYIYDLDYQKINTVAAEDCIEFIES